MESPLAAEFGNVPIQDPDKPTELDVAHVSPLAIGWRSLAEDLLHTANGSGAIVRVPAPAMLFPELLTVPPPES